MFVKYVDLKIVAKLSSSWQVQYQSNWELRLVLISVWHPPHPGKYIWATSRLPRKLKFGMEALFNQTRSMSQPASYPQATTSCS